MALSMKSLFVDFLWSEKGQVLKAQKSLWPDNNSENCLCIIADDKTHCAAGSMIHNIQHV